MKKHVYKMMAVLSALVILAAGAMPAAAYWDRGTVSISAGASSLSMTAGETTSVTVSVSPSSSTQLPGCGMAECPQTCGDKDCFDANGECKCGGTTYTTYYTSVSVSSSNTSAATATYSNGVLTIHAVGKGDAVLTLTASLRQFTSSSASITVKVSGSATPTPTPTATPGPTASPTPTATPRPTASPTPTATPRPTSTPRPTATPKPTSTPAPTATAKPSPSASPTPTARPTPTAAPTSTAKPTASPKPTQTASPTATAMMEVVTAPAPTEAPEPSAPVGAEETPESGQNENTSEIISSKGRIVFCEIEKEKQGGDILGSISGKDEYAVFRKTDTAGNVMYSWEFCGRDLTDSFDADYNIDLLWQESGVIAVKCAHSGALPGTAKLNIRVSEWFKNGAVVELCEADDSGAPLSGGIRTTVENGYAEFDIDSCGSFILRQVSEAEPEAAGLPGWVIPAAAAIVICAAGAAVIVIRKRKKDA